MNGMRIIDTHSHLYGEEYNDINDVVSRAQSEGVDKIFLPNINEESILPMLHLCESYPGFFYPMMGLHPTDITPDYMSVLDRMELLLDSSNQYIAVGEVGLDYYWDKTYYNEQMEAFERQILWSLKYELPLMIHSRSAHRELMDILTPYKNKGVKGVFHSFGGTLEEAEELLSFDSFMLGINGVVTFKKSSLPEVLSSVPLSRIVLETDSPYLTPVPYRGKRNESSYLIYIIQKLSEIYNKPVTDISLQTTENTRKLFYKAF